MLLEWLDNLNVDEPYIVDQAIDVTALSSEEKDYIVTLELEAGEMNLVNDLNGEDPLDILRHGACYELTANGKTLIVDRETGAVELV